MPQRTDVDHPLLLLAGLPLPLSPHGNGFAWTAAGDAREVLLRLRAAHVDLLLTGPTVGATPFDSLMRRVRAVRPAQKWALVAPDVGPESEIEARSLGVLAIFDGPPSAAQLREIFRQLRPLRPVRPASHVFDPQPNAAGIARGTFGGELS